MVIHQIVNYLKLGSPCGNPASHSKGLEMVIGHREQGTYNIMKRTGATRGEGMHVATSTYNNLLWCPLFNQQPIVIW